MAWVPCASTGSNSDSAAAIASLHRAHDRVEAADEEQVRQLIRRWRCDSVYLDIGSNIGVQVRKLHEPHKYPGSPVLPIFLRTFGPPPRCRTCALGVEPNLRSHVKLSAVEGNLTRAGVGVHFFEAAAGDAAGMTTLHLQRQRTAGEDAGASSFDLGFYDRAKTITREVRVLSLPRLISLVRREIGPRGSGAGSRAGRIVMKLDVEGQEGTILPALLETGVLCEVDFAFFEFHADSFKRAAKLKECANATTEESRSACRMRSRVGEEFFSMHLQPHPWNSGRSRAMAWATVSHRVRGSAIDYLSNTSRWAARAEPSCPTELLTLDDESYSHDGQPFPLESLCPAA